MDEKGDYVGNTRSDSTKSCFADFSNRNRNSSIHHKVRDNVARFYNNRVNIARNYPIKQSVTLCRDKLCCSYCGVHDFVLPRRDFNRQTNFSKFRRSWISVRYHLSNSKGPKMH